MVAGVNTNFPLLSYFPKLQFRFLPFYLFAFSLFLLFPFMTFLLSFLLLILLPASFYIFHSSLPVFLVELISFQLIVSVSV